MLLHSLQHHIASVAMSTFGRLTTALFSGNNENNLAFLSINAEFSLVKYVPPEEFHVFGASLSKQRRNEAEDGSLHKTARRLGGLFESMVPATPGLVKAYGTRASEIASNADVNPKGSSKDGPFEAYIGADGTSIWAAATSSPSDADAHPPLAMHLLACMLARAFKSDEAIATWWELVQTRRQELERKINTEPQTTSTYIAAQQDITRDHLAVWDASARAWLRGADEEKMKQCKQLQLIFDNLHLRPTSYGSPYESVIHVWRDAMMCVEQCIGGTPQQVSNGAVLLALSSWHLYPDLIIAHENTIKVSFHDSLLETSGALTIGLEFAPGSRPTGVHWCLALSHLKYYGDPIKVQSSPDVQRVSMDQLLVMVFGNLLSSWNIPKDEACQVFCARWLIELSDVLHPSSHAGTTWLCDEFSWIHLLARAGLKYLELHHSDPKTCSMLLAWGGRRLKKFLGNTLQDPFFRLNNSLVTSAFNEPDALEAGIHFLRKLAKAMKLAPDMAVIRWSVEFRSSQYVELMTAVPHVSSSSGQTLEDNCVPQETHCRWIGAAVRTSRSTTHKPCPCKALNVLCPCKYDFGACSYACPAKGSRQGCVEIGVCPAVRQSAITKELQERCCFLGEPKVESPVPLQPAQSTRDRSTAGDNLGMRICESGLGTSFSWLDLPKIFSSRNSIGSLCKPRSSLDNGVTECTCFNGCDRGAGHDTEADFTLIHGSASGLGLYIRKSPKDHKVERLREAAAQELLRHDLPPHLAIENLGHIRLRKDRLLANVIRRKARVEYANPTPDQNYPAIDVVSVYGATFLRFEYVKSLSLLSMAWELYQNLFGATIPTSLSNTALCQSKWLSHDWGDKERFTSQTTSKTRRESYSPSDKLRFPHRHLTRAEQFACIALFESGLHSVAPSLCKPVIALASANSIFIADELLTDPATTKRGHVKRVVGNFGRSGISLLVLPPEPPRVRSLGDNWRAVPHQPHDYRREDNLRGTTLALSFTDWKRPLVGSQRGMIDEDLNFVEGVISVHDRGIWVADLNLMDLKVVAASFTCLCNSERGIADVELTSIDSWEELLDAPDNLGVVRAHGNWAARLAAVAIRHQQGHQNTTYVVPSEVDPCLKCLGRVFQNLVMVHGASRAKGSEELNFHNCNVGVIID